MAHNEHDANIYLAQMACYHETHDTLYVTQPRRTLRTQRKRDTRVMRILMVMLVAFWCAVFTAMV